MESNQKKILIIEDEKSLVRALEIKLVREGYVVSTVSNGEQAIALLANETYSLIISDLMMPKVDGFQVLQMIKENNIKTPVIILTNLSQPEDEKRVLDLGASHFLVKSDTPLLSIIEIVNQLVS